MSALCLITASRQELPSPAKSHVTPISGLLSRRWQDLASAFLDGEKPPPAGDALEDMRTSIHAFHFRSGDQVLHRARKKNLPRLSAGGYACTDVHSDTCACRKSNPDVLVIQSAED